MSDWVPVRTADGSWTLAHPDHGETCHSRAGAWSEALERYARPCRLRERALELRTSGRGVVRVLDVGTGLGWNIAAALHELSGTGVRLEVLSLELDRRVIEHALELFRAHGAALAAEPRSAYEPVAAALARGAPRAGVALGSNDGRLELLLGDARSNLAAYDGPAFDAVFLDAFSPRVAPDLWQPAFLAELARRMASASLLSTYTVSLAVRAGLTAAGLRVGPGPRVGTKAAGTLASPDRELPAFDPRTARRVAARTLQIRNLLGEQVSGEPML